LNHKRLSRFNLFLDRHLERALLFCARLVEADGPILIPLFESLERDLAVMRRDQDAMARARAMVAQLA
jgi:hypothetical protein